MWTSFSCVACVALYFLCFLCCLRCFYCWLVACVAYDAYVASLIHIQNPPDALTGGWAGGGAEFAVNFRVCSGNICIWIVYLKMTPVAISRILRIQTRPQGSCMQCNFHAIYKQIVMRPVLDIVERLVVHYLPNDLFNAASHSIEDPVVPALIWQPPLGTIAFGTRGEWAMNNCAQLSFGVFGEHVRAAVIGRIPQDPLVFFKLQPASLI